MTMKSESIPSYDENDSFENFYTTNYQIAKCYAIGKYHIPEADAEDLVQTSMMQLSMITPTKSQKGLFYTILHRRYVDMVDDYVKKPIDEFCDHTLEGIGKNKHYPLRPVEEQVEKRLNLQAMYKKIPELNNKQQIAITDILAGTPQHEAALIQKIQANVVNSLRNRAMQKLRNLLNSNP